MPTCSICSEVLGASLSAAVCGHVYHTECIANWLKQKPSCPLCKHALSSQQLTALHFQPQHKLAQLQQQHAHEAATNSDTAHSSSPFSLHLRLQALRAHLDELNLQLEQSTARLADATAQLDSLRQKCALVTKEWEAATLQEESADAELTEQQQSLDAKSGELKRLQLQHRSAYRQLLALHTLPLLRRRRAASGAELHATDLQLMVQQAEASMPSTAFSYAREEVKAALRDEALSLLLRLAVAEVKAELEQLDGQSAELKGRRRRVTELQREQERLQRELDGTKQRVAELEEQKAALLKRENRARSAAGLNVEATAREKVEVSTASSLTNSLPQKRKSSQLSASTPVASREDDDVIILSG